MPIINPGDVLPSADTAAQISAFLNALGGGDAVEPLQQVVSNNGAAAFTTHTFVSGTPYANATEAKQLAYIGITGGSAGTVEVQLTDPSSVVHTVIPATAANGVASQMLIIPIPAGWSCTVTVAVATIVASSVITSGV